MIQLEKDKSAQTLLGLLRASLGCGSQVSGLCSLTGREWKRLIDMSFDGGVAALSVDGYNTLSGISENSLETDESLEDLKLKWFGSVLQVEDDYRYKFEKAESFASALAQKGVECKVLKGLSFATYYVHPGHRGGGDCDVYLGPSGWEVGNQTALELGGRYEFGTYKHSHLYLGTLMIENHRYLTDFNGTRQGKRIEKLLERVIAESPARTISGSHLLCPNDRFNAIFLIKHAHGNFIYECMTLRMIYDWAAMLLRCGSQLDWKRLYEELDECRLRPFADVMTSLCVEYFGIISPSPATLCHDKALVAEIMQDTINGGINAKGPETFLLKCLRIARRFARIWHYRALATESVPRMIWNNFAFSSYMKRKIEM